MHTDDIRKFLNEARKIDPDVDYHEVSKTKKDPTIDRVVAKLKGTPSGILTRIAAQFAALKKAEEELTKLKNEMRPHIKGLAADYFDDADRIYTRVVETLQFAITLSKQIDTPAGEKESIDYEQIFLALLDMLPELGDELATLKHKFTTTIPTPAKTPPAKMSIKHRDDVKPQIAKKHVRRESFKYVKRDVTEQEAAEEFDSLDRRLADWDKRFASLKKKFFRSI